jgi:beta-lactamase regulating signal transducer with metallopeptidase domain/uncharacterized GH25 family protein
MATAWPILADAAIKGAILLSLAGIATWAMRRASAAQRHCVWLLAIGGTLMLPLLVALLPAWRILPQWVGMETTRTVMLAQDRPAALLPPATPRLASTLPNDESPAGNATFPPVPAIEHSSPRSGVHSPAAAAPAAATAIEPPTVAAAAPAWLKAFSIADTLLAIWGLGAASFLIRYLLGLWLLWRAGRTSRPMEGEIPQTILRQVAETIGLRRSIVLLESPRRTIPMTWGILHTVVLMPAEASDWPADRLRVVLTHELAHVKRRDCLSQLVAQIAFAVHWFNPLMWLAWLRLLAESERACDDLVLTLGSKASDYAEHLLTVATGTRVAPMLSTVAIAMARPSDLRGRLPAILDANRNRRRLTRPGALLAITLLIAIAVPLAIVQQTVGQADSTTAAAAAAASETKTATEETKATSQPGQPASQTAETKPSQAEQASTEEPPALLSASGTVVDPAGKPVAGATVYLREWSTYRMSNERFSRTKDVNDILATVQTDAQGAFRFENVPAKPLYDQWLRQIPWDVVVVAKPYAMAWRHLDAAQQSKPFEITLEPATRISGQVTDEQGKPVADADVRVSQITPLDCDHPCHAYADPTVLDLAWSRLTPAGKTDANGKVTMEGLPGKKRLSLNVEHAEHRWGLVLVATTDQAQPDIDVPEYGDGKRTMRSEKVYASNFVATSKPPLPRLVGRVIAADTMKPLEDIRIAQYGWVAIGTNQLGRFVIDAVSLSQRRFIVHGAPNSDYLGQVLFIDFPNDKQEIPIEIELRRGEIVSGVVVNDDNGQGVAGVSVYFDNGFDVNKTTEPGTFSANAVTDANGRFHLAAPPSKGKLRISGPVRGYDFPQLSWPPEDIEGFFKELEIVAGKPIPEIKFAVSRKAPEEVKPLVRQETPGNSYLTKAIKTVMLAVEGVVVDSDGKPVADAEVGLGQWFRDPEGEFHPVTTDQAGRFSFRIRPQQHSSDEMVVAVEKQRRLRGHLRLPDVAKDDTAAATLKIELASTGIVRGSMMDGDKPVAGISIQFDEHVPTPGSTNGALTCINRDFAQTDEQGRFEFPWVEAGRRFHLHAFAERGYTDAQCDGQVDAGQTLELEPFVVMRTDRSVGGIVVDPDGNPVAGAMVGAEMRSGQNIPFAFLQHPTGKDGRFVIRGVPNEPLSLTAYMQPPQDGKSHQLRFVAHVEAEPGQTDVHIVLDPKLVRNKR